MRKKIYKLMLSLLSLMGVSLLAASSGSSSELSKNREYEVRPMYGVNPGPIRIPPSDHVQPAITYQISGHVYSSATELSIPGIQVSFSNQFTNTDESGFFQLTINQDGALPEELPVMFIDVDQDESTGEYAAFQYIPEFSIEYDDETEITRYIAEEIIVYLDLMQE